MPLPESTHELLDALDFRDADTLAEFLAEDFRSSGNLALALDRGRALALTRACFTAFSDFVFRFSEAREEEGLLCLKFAPAGTHDGILDLRPLGIPLELAPTGRRLELPASSAALRFNARLQVASVELQQADGAGLRDFVAQLGAELPASVTG